MSLGDTSGGGFEDHPAMIRLLFTDTDASGLGLSTLALNCCRVLYCDAEKESALKRVKDVIQIFTF